MDSAFVRSKVRASATRAPWLYNWRNEHGAFIQRLLGGVHDEDFRLLGRLTVGRPLVIDVGANVGQTMQTVKTLLPSARVVSIEPSVLVLPALVKASKRYPDTEVAPFAAGSEYGTAVISTPVVRGLLFTQYATLTEVDLEATAEAITDGGFGATTARDVTVRRAHCVVVPLDAIFAECDVLKVDSEGFEDAVFDGARSLVKNSLPVVLVERPSSKALQHLHGLGYKTVHASRVNTLLAHPSAGRGLL